MIGKKYHRIPRSEGFNVNFNRFIVTSRRFDNVTFQEMVEKLSATSQLSPTLLRNYGVKSLEEWAQSSGKDVETLFLMHNLERTENINDILKYLHEKLKPLISSQKIMDKTLCIANVGYEVLFGNA